MWEALFDECREHEGQWRKALTPMKRTTASQLASDIRNSWKRSTTKSRLRGLRPDEVWDAAWGYEDETEDEDACFIWLMYKGKRDPSEMPAKRARAKRS